MAAWLWEPEFEGPTLKLMHRGINDGDDPRLVEILNQFKRVTKLFVLHSTTSLPWVLRS